MKPNVLAAPRLRRPDKQYDLTRNVYLNLLKVFRVFQSYVKTFQLESELDEVTDRLEEQGGATAAQVDLNKKRENEMMKLKRDLEEARIENEQNIAVMRKKQTDSINEVTDQLDQAQKLKAK